MKKIIFISLLLISLVFVTIGCGGSSDSTYTYDGVELLQNGSVESAITGVWLDDGQGIVGTTHVWAPDSDAAIGTHSLKIVTDVSQVNSCFWYQTITNIPVGKQLKLSAKIKTVDIKGQGIAISIRCDDATTPTGNAEMFATTYGTILIKGTGDWTQFRVELTDKVTSNMKSITVYLVAVKDANGGTTGTVYFDDISLIR